MPPSLDSAATRIRYEHFAFQGANRINVNIARLRCVPEDLLDFYALCDGAFDDFQSLGII